MRKSELIMFQPTQAASKLLLPIKAVAQIILFDTRESVHSKI